MRLLPYGDRALLAEVDDNPTVLALRDAVAAEPGVLNTVPASRTLLVEFDPGLTSAQAVRTALSSADAAPRPMSAGPLVEIDVRYDGADVHAVADDLRLSGEEVVRRHADATYTVAFCGFSPGFAYLTGLDPALYVPRLPEPRTSVPAGAVGIAAEYTGVYPRSSPGGWRLLGHTDAPLWDTSRTPPALLTPGTTVRFRPR
jgi:KipI family sensor histidine kinase inhibitor